MKTDKVPEHEPGHDLQFVHEDQIINSLIR